MKLEPYFADSDIDILLFPNSKLPNLKMHCSAHLCPSVPAHLWMSFSASHTAISGTNSHSESMDSQKMRYYSDYSASCEHGLDHYFARPFDNSIPSGKDCVTVGRGQGKKDFGPSDHLVGGPLVHHFGRNTDCRNWEDLMEILDYFGYRCFKSPFLNN